MDDYEKGRMDTIAGSYAALAAEMGHIRQSLKQHTEQEDKDRERYTEDRTQVLLALAAIQTTLDGHKQALERICPHIESCKIRERSVKWLMGATTAVTAIVTGGINAAVWAANHINIR